MIIILLGPPGCGKGTSSNLICSKHRLYHVSTGDMLRKRMQQDDALGKEIAVMMGTGELFPDTMINEIVKELVTSRLLQDEYDGLLFDGYPRTLQQAIYLNLLLTENDLSVTGTLLFKIADDVIVERVSSRRVDRNTGTIYNLIFNPPPKDDPTLDLFQRDDDKEEIILRRLEIYREQTEPLVDLYTKQGVIYPVSADQTIENMLKEITEVLETISVKPKQFYWL